VPFLKPRRQRPKTGAISQGWNVPRPSDLCQNNNWRQRTFRGFYPPWQILGGTQRQSKADTRRPAVNRVPFLAPTQWGSWQFKKLPVPAKIREPFWAICVM